jgi:hypothetical protein
MSVRQYRQRRLQAGGFSRNVIFVSLLSFVDIFQTNKNNCRFIVRPPYVFLCRDRLSFSDVRSEADETLFCNRKRLCPCALQDEAEENIEH